MSPPLTPSSCDLRGLPFMPLECARLLESDLFALSTGDEFKAALALWCRSWTQAPAASVPNDERLLARLTGLALADWRVVADMALRGWVECDDGRLYHPVVADKALRAWIERIAYQERSAKANAGRHKEFKFDPAVFASRRSEAINALIRIDPDAAGEFGVLLEGAQTPPSRTDTAPARSPSRNEKPSEGRGRGNIPVGATPDQKAWREAVDVLTAGDRMTEQQGRAFFGKLLSTYKLQPHQLLSSLATALVNGTPDPAAYLTAAAKAVAGRSGPKPVPTVAHWSDEVWRSAVSAYDADPARWDVSVMGPKPGQAGCLVPEGVMVDLGLAEAA